MPVSRVTVHGVNGGHKLVHNAGAQKRELIFRVFFFCVKCTDCFILQSGGAEVETISPVARKLSGSAADMHNFGRTFSKH